MIPRATQPARVHLFQPVLVGLGLFACLATARAQVVLDGSFGTSGPLTGPNYNITAGVGLTRGNNLFQSFSQFNLKAGDVATFTGPANIQNILSRVTGGSPSSIDGTIRSGIAGANFYFINPSGVIFGPNASVDVSGAFAVSTANYLKLADGAKFVAALGADDSMLSSAPVVAFGFLDGASGSIDVSGSLRSAPGTPLSVIGSTVNVHDGATLEALGSQINLTGVSSAGEITPSIQASIKGGVPAQSDPTPPGTVVIRGGRLVVENAHVDVSNTGGNLVVDLTDSLEVLNGGQLTTENSGATKGGSIFINAPKVTVDGQDGALLTQIAAQTSSDDPLGAGGDVIIKSDSLDVLGGLLSQISVSTSGAADAGRVDITTGAMRVEDASQISANAAPVSGGGPGGAGGQVVIRADSLDVGTAATISASTLGDANAGSIDITAHSISIDNASVTTYSSGAGNGGDIRVQSDTLSLNGMFGSITALALGINSGLPAGNGGNIDIKTGSLQLLNDSAISVSTYGDGNAGNIHITADSITLDTAHPQPGIFPGISSFASTLIYNGVGSGGDVVINTGTLTMHNNMLITAATSTTGTGGNVNITASSVLVDSGASIQSSSDGPGRAGTVQLQSSGNIQLSSGGSVSTSAPQSGAGDILVTSGSEVQLTDSSITARAGPGGGGNINVTAPDLVYLLRGSLDAQAVGDGGNLTIQSTSIVLNQGGLISQSSSKNGGNITIISDAFLQSDSVINPSAPFGIPGTVLVTAPDVDLSASLIPLPGNLLDAESQMRPDCAVRLSGEVSSFVILGRGGLPLEPGGFVPSGATSSGDEKH
jgi:filamentous hemagglutinin family protein